MSPHPPPVPRAQASARAAGTNRAMLLVILAAIVATLAILLVSSMRAGGDDVHYLLLLAPLPAVLVAAMLLKPHPSPADGQGNAPQSTAPYGGMPPQPGAFPTHPPQPHSARPVEQSLQIDIDGVEIPLREGLTINLGAEPALDGRGAGVRGEIVPHPRRPGVLGLRNAGEGPWTAHLRDGRDQPIDKSQNVRLAPGVRIDFGDALVGEVKARPA